MFTFVPDRVKVRVYLGKSKFSSVCALYDLALYDPELYSHAIYTQDKWPNEEEEDAENLSVETVSKVM